MCYNSEATSYYKDILIVVYKNALLIRSTK